MLSWYVLCPWTLGVVGLNVGGYALPACLPCLQKQSAVLGAVMWKNLWGGWCTHPLCVLISMGDECSYMYIVRTLLWRWVMTYTVVRGIVPFLHGLLLFSKQFHNCVHVCIGHMYIHAHVFSCMCAYLAIVWLLISQYVKLRTKYHREVASYLSKRGQIGKCHACSWILDVQLWGARGTDIH